MNKPSDHIKIYSSDKLKSNEFIIVSPHLQPDGSNNLFINDLQKPSFNILTNINIEVDNNTIKLSTTLITKKWDS